MQWYPNRRRRVGDLPIAALQALEQRCLLTVGVSEIVSPVAVSSAFPQIEWTEADNALHYEIHINNLTTGQRRIVREGGIAATRYTVADGLPTSDYRVWIKAHNDSESSVWSQPFDFRVESDVLPEPLTTESVAFDDSNNQLTVRWDSAFWTESYEIEVRSQSDTIGQVFRKSDIFDEFISIPSPLPVGTYQAWVRGVNSTGSGLWSDAASFTVVGSSEIPSTPQLSVQSSFIQDAPIEILWSNQAAPAFTELQINDVTGQPFRVNNLRNRAGNRALLESGLPTGDYRIWGRRSTEAGMSLWSDPVDFQIGDPVALPLPARPVIQVPATPIPGTRPIIQWTEDTNSARYEVWVNVTSKQHDGPWFYTSSHKESVFVPTNGFEPGESYKLWVRGFNDDNVNGEWSNPVEIQIADTVPVPGQPNLPLSGGTFLTPQPNLEWNRIPAAETYQVWLSDLTLGHQIEFADHLRDTSFTPSADLPIDHDLSLLGSCRQSG